jgi:hypothetical protein
MQLILNDAVLISKDDGHDWASLSFGESNFRLRQIRDEPIAVQGEMINNRNIEVLLAVLLVSLEQK